MKTLQSALGDNASYFSFPILLHQTSVNFFQIFIDHVEKKSISMVLFQPMMNKYARKVFKYISIYL